MNRASLKRRTKRLLFFIGPLILAAFAWIPPAFGQTASTGVLSGAVTDPQGATVAGAEIKVTNVANGATRTVTSGSDGSYLLPLLPPGSYRVEVVVSGFKRVKLEGVRIELTNTTTLEIRLEVGAADQQVTVRGDSNLVKTESSALGNVLNEKAVVNLPIVTRNYTQVLGLFPGVSASLSEGDVLGRGSNSIDPAFFTTGKGTYVHGARSYDNHFLMNGVAVDNLEGGGISGGIPVPNPDTIHDLQVQTGLYDATFGGNAGANISIVTKGGSNQFHGALFEFFRNEALNAGDFFDNRVGRRKPPLRQHQYGFTLGGPVIKDKLLFFTSYQGTRQVNGALPAGQGQILGPPFTDDRSAAAIGSLFGGPGSRIRADGSNINPVALRLLQLKLPDGSFLFPTPDVVRSSPNIILRGITFVTANRTFDEDQYMINLDYLHTAKSKFEGRFFSASSEQVQPNAGIAAGFPLRETDKFRDFTLAHSYILSEHLVNNVLFGFHRVDAHRRNDSPYKFSDVGINAPPDVDDFPVLNFSNNVLRIGSTFAETRFAQDHFSVQDSLSYVRGRHTLSFGGGVTDTRIDVPLNKVSASLSFATFVDFLLGQSAAQNGTFISNIAASSYTVGLTERAFRTRYGFLYAQDDFKLTRRLTLNLGLRYERIGQFYDALGRNSNFDIALANPNPPAGGTLAGFILPDNFPGGQTAFGVTRSDTNLTTNGDGKNNFAPRVGFAWQMLPKSSRLVLRGGYGVYYSRLTSETAFATTTSPPFQVTRSQQGPAGAAATLSNPFAQPLLSDSDFPTYTPYSPTSRLFVQTVAQDYRPSIVQQYGLNLQSEIVPDFLLEIGYVGTRGTHLLRSRDVNQAQLASPENPIRGVTTNTLANILQRAPIQGFSAAGITQIETSGASWYNGLEASVTKRFSRGLQFQASYTFSKALDSVAGNTDVLNTGSLAGGLYTVFGDQNDPKAGYGRSIFDRTHRFVAGYVYDFPIPSSRAGLVGKLLGGWATSGIVTIQTGQALTFGTTNFANIYGTNRDRAQIAAGCTYADLTTSGPVSERLGAYFNNACFFVLDANGNVPPNPTPLRPPAIGNGTGFGNSGAGIVTGPGQQNLDFALIKRTPVGWLNEGANIEFRAEFFNALNHPQFSNPSADPSSPNFGEINSMSVAPRIIQFALKLNF
ncbi:MAG: TonB-dependent receptor domain-containing protein [Blastocatellia bacterium]